MTLRDCPRAPELSDLLQIGQWPTGCNPALREHVEHCAACREAVLVMQLLREDRAAMIRAMPLASPGLLWWRAQILQHQAAIRQASRPIHVAITVSLVTSAVIVVGVLLSFRSQIASWISAVVAVPVSAQPDSISSLTMTSAPILLALFALAALAAICGLAVYAAVHSE